MRSPVLVSLGRDAFRSFGIALLTVVLAAHATAADVDAGMVLGQTVTVSGQDFFQGFVAMWREKSISERTLIVVRERPSARTGSVISIEHRGRRLLQLSLPASRALLRGISEQAAETVWQRLTGDELDARLDPDRDLARDEL
jgi:curli production assembly/transport component CsgE